MPSSVLDLLPPRVRNITRELGKFLVVGGFCFVLDTLVALFLRFQVGLGPNTSKALATILATVVSYAGNRMWSFAHRVDESRGHGAALTTYAAINGIGLIITLVPVTVAHYLLSATGPVAFTVSGVLGTAAATVFRFWGYRRYVFAHTPELAERTALV